MFDYLVLFIDIGLLISIGNKTPKSQSGCYIKDTLIQMIDKTFSNIEHMNSTHIYAKATILDPRYKRAAFTHNINADTAEQEIKNEVAKLLRDRGN